MLLQNQTKIWHHRERTFIDQNEVHKGGFGISWGFGGYISHSPINRRMLRKGSNHMYTVAYPVSSILSPPFLETRVLGFTFDPNLWLATSVLA